MTARAAVSTREALQAATVVADRLERLVARIRRDLDCDAGESPAVADRYWASVLDGVVTFAEECGRVVADPAVAAVLDAALDLRPEADGEVSTVPPPRLPAAARR